MMLVSEILTVVILATFFKGIDLILSLSPAILFVMYMHTTVRVHATIVVQGCS